MEKPSVGEAPESHWNCDVGGVRMQPLPAESVMPPWLMQNDAADKGPLMRTWPSLSWPAVPLTAPEAVSSKQQVSTLRMAKALEPAARARATMVDFIVMILVRWIAVVVLMVVSMLYMGL